MPTLFDAHGAWLPQRWADRRLVMAAIGRDGPGRVLNRCGGLGKASQIMGGFGSGRYGGRPTVESALRLDIDNMMQWGGIRAFAHLIGEMHFNFYGDQIDVKFESRVGEPWESWLGLKYAMADCSTGEEVEIDDKIFLATTRRLGPLRLVTNAPFALRRRSETTRSG